MKTFNTPCYIFNSKRWRVLLFGAIRDKLPTGMKKLQRINALAGNFGTGFLESSHQSSHYEILNF